MDFNKVIREKREELNQLLDLEALDKVLRHLDAAEKHFQNARVDGGSEFFTDVIYRANQVFEGILKEAYKVIAEKDASDITPAQIEKYFSEQKIFRPRVMEYFTRYRQEWRNPVTHDHRLDFDEPEAFLAYSTVCGFCFVAVHQMIQVLASQKVAAGRFQRKVQFSARFIAELLAAELPGLVRTLQGSWATLRNDIRLSESGLIGGIEGLIKSSAQGVNVAIEPRLSVADKLLRPDLLISHGDDRLVVEVKKYRGYADRQPMNEQLAEYSHATNAIGGIGVLVPYVFPENAALKFRVEEITDSRVPIYWVAWH